MKTRLCLFFIQKYDTIHSFILPLHIITENKAKNSIDKLYFNHATIPANELSQIEIDAIINAVDAQARVNGTSSIVVDFDKYEMLYRTNELIYIDEVSINDVKRPCTNPYWP